MLNKKLDASELIVIENGEQLTGFTFVEQRQLQDLPRYQHFLKAVKKGYANYLLKNPGADRRPYQYEYAAVACCRRKNLMGWSMRTGKTTASLLMLYGLYNGRIKELRPKSIHIAVPSILASMSWVKEMSGFPAFNDCFTVVQSEKDLEAATTPIIIYGHDFPKRSCRALKNSSRPFMSRLLARLRPNVLIVDEVHGLKNKSSRRQHLSYVRQYSRRVLALTGTPSEGSLTEINNLMSFIYRSDWPYARPETFSKLFSVKERLPANYLQGSRATVDGPERYLQQLDASKMPDYYQLLRRYCHRVGIHEPQVQSCISIPDTEVILHSVNPTKEQTELYNEYVEQRRTQLQRAADAVSSHQVAEALQLINPLIKLANHPELTGVSSTPKIEQVVQLANAAAGKVVVFCNRVDSAWVVSQRLRKEFGDRVVRVYAQDPREPIPTLSEEGRIAAVTRFQYEPEIKVGVFSINLAAQAIELNQASDVIFYCLPWSSVKIQQAISRPVGPGNPHSLVKLHYLYQEGFIDEYQVLLAINKIKNAKMLLDYELEVNSDEEDLSPTDAIRRLLANH